MRLGWRKSCLSLLVYWFIGLLVLIPVHAAYGQSSVLDLNESIQARKSEQRELQQKINQYSTKIRTTQRQAASLKNQINVLDANIAKTETEIKSKEIEVEQLALEAQLIERQIQEEEARIESALRDIAAVLRQMNQYGERQYLEVILAEPSFSAAYDVLFYQERTVRQLQTRLNAMKTIREILDGNKKLLEDQRQKTKDAKEGLGILRNSFSQEKRVKEALFGKTKSTEAEFQELLSELRFAAQAIDSEIVTLEKNIRDRLDLADKLAGDTGLLSWPVTPVGGISAQFHDQDYPFRYLFEHSGTDIRTPQGTPVRAAASGYVAKAFNGGLGIRPSYVMLVHGQEMSTVYMHLAQINVAPDTFVARGDIIGRSGGTPRTNGAGRWSTGPHLHFETRLSGVPVDPIGYLP